MNNPYAIVRHSDLTWCCWLLLFIYYLSPHITAIDRYDFVVENSGKEYKLRIKRQLPSIAQLLRRK